MDEDETESENLDKEFEEMKNNQKVKVNLINSKTNEKITLEGDQIETDKLREFIDTAKETFEENQRFRAEKESKSQTALINDAQLTGQTTIPLDSNDGLPTDMQIFSDELDMISQLEKQNTPESRKALNDLLVRSTKGSWSAEYNGDDSRPLYRKPRNEQEKADFAKKLKMWSVSK